MKPVTFDTCHRTEVEVGTLRTTGLETCGTLKYVVKSVSFGAYRHTEGKVGLKRMGRGTRENA